MRAALAIIGLTLGISIGHASADGNDDGSVLPSYSEAKAYVDTLRFKLALPILKELVRAEPDNPDAWNLLAFSQRNLGEIKSARRNYDKALALDPSHKGANEYLGEMFLILDDLASAQRQLATLASICPQGCEQHDDLAQAIDAYKARQGS